MFVTSEMLKTIARPFDLLSSLLSTAPQPGMRATALDAPGSMLFEVGGKWGGSFGYVSALQVATLQAAIASIAIGAEAVVPNAAVLGGVSRLRRGAAVWAPFTAIIKALNVLPFALVYLMKATKKPNLILNKATAIMPIVSGLITIFGYLLAEGLLYSFPTAWTSVPFSIIQAVASAVVYYAAAAALDKISFKSRIYKSF